MKHGILCCLWVLLAQWLAAQTGGGLLRGRVLDAAGKGPLKQANILVYPVKDSMATQHALADDNGIFVLKNLSLHDTLELWITYTGYQPYRRQLLLGGRATFNLGDVALKAAVRALDTIVFKVPPTPVVVKGDTTEFNAAAFKMRPNAVVEDLLRKLPGLEVDAAGVITFNGKPVNKILVDGKDFFAGDLLTATRNLPADIVSKIQMTDTKTLEEAFGDVPADGNSKTLNIKLKKGIKPLFGYITGGGGTSRRYELSGMVNHFDGPEQVSVVGSMNNLNKLNPSPGTSLEVSNPGNGITATKTAGINYNNDWGRRIKVSGSYFYNNAATTNETLIDRKQLITADSSFFSNARNTQEDNTTGQRAQFSFDYAPDSANRVTINPAFNTSRATSGSNGNTVTSASNGDKINESSQSVATSSRNNNYALQLFWGHKFARKGRLLTINMNVNRNEQNSRSLNESYNAFYHNNIIDSAGTLRQQLFTDNNSNTYSFGATYTEPISPLLRLTVRENISGGHSGSDKQNYILDSAGRVIRMDSTTSGSFSTSNMNNSTGLSLQYRGKRWEGTAGITGLYNKIRNTYPEGLKTASSLEQFNYAPQANLQYRFTKEKSIRFSYSASTRQPSPDQLQPIPDNTNPLLVKLGNPDLTTSFSQSFSLSYSGFHGMQNLNASVQYNPTSNKILNSVYYDNYGRQYSQYVNVNGAYSTGVNIALSNTLKWGSHSLRLNPGVNLNYNRDLSLVNRQQLTTANTVWGPRMGLQYSYKDKVIVGGNYSLTYNDVRYNNSATIQPIHYVVQHLDNTVQLYIANRFRVLSALNYTYNSNTPPGFSRSALLWNLGLGQALLKKQQLLVKLLVYDVLRQQNNLRTVTTINYVENTQAAVLQQYGLLSITYQFRSK